MRTANHASRAKGIRKTKLQGSDAQSSKTLQSQNSLQEKKRFQLNRLTVLHDRLNSVLLDASRISPMVLKPTALSALRIWAEKWTFSTVSLFAFISPFAFSPTSRPSRRWLSR